MYSLAFWASQGKQATNLKKFQQNKQAFSVEIIFCISLICFCLLKGSETQAKVELEEDRERQEERYNMQLSALNENLGTLRNDMMQADTRSREMEKALEDLRGEKHGSYGNYITWQILF